ncbi:hypothetical protein GQ54DRAFT_219687 [Martensiomyces pterosporus]|nr:hypothetical protein GQ54DRAFT_219687 [Martensiomyces pterosporus]
MCKALGGASWLGRTAPFLLGRCLCRCLCRRLCRQTQNAYFSAPASPQLGQACPNGLAAGQRRCDHAASAVAQDKGVNRGTLARWKCMKTLLSGLGASLGHADIRIHPHRTHAWLLSTTYGLAPFSQPFKQKRAQSGLPAPSAFLSANPLVHFSFCAYSLDCICALCCDTINMLSTDTRHNRHSLPASTAAQNPSSSSHRSIHSLFSFNSAMPLFGKRKPKLQSAICDAMVDVSAYDKLYSMFAKQPDAPAEALEFVLRTIAMKEHKEPKLLNRIGSNARSSSAENDVSKSLSLLKVLHGIVWSFPRNMGLVFKELTTGAVLLKTVISPAVPITIRETLLCMVSNWCILYRESLGVRNILENVVDSVKQKIGLKPTASLLPIPPVTREQEGWAYPPVVQPPSNPYAAYQGIPYAGTQMVTFQQMPPQQPAYAYGSLVGADPVVAAQQQALVQAQNAQSHSTRSRGASFASVSGQENSGLTPTFIEHMETSAQELKSLCDMLTENLISLNVEEDPRTNPVVGDMMKEVNKRKTAIHNFMGMLTPDNMETLQKLSVASEEVERCLWLYDNTLSAHNEWMAIQESLKTSAAEESRMRGAVPGPYSSLLPYAGYQPESSNATTNLIATAAATGNETSSMARAVPDSHLDDVHNLVDSRSSSHGLSQKAKGKMAEVPSQTDYELDLATINNAGSSSGSHPAGGPTRPNYMD